MTKFVQVTEACWLWSGRINAAGYGNVGYKGKYHLAHRVVYEIFRGKIPDGLCLDHLCRNRRCVNPAHLEPVTHRVNILRGECNAAKNLRKTHCKRGHPLSGDNIYISQGNRSCKMCFPIRVAEAEARKAKGNA